MIYGRTPLCGENSGGASPPCHRELEMAHHMQLCCMKAHEPKQLSRAPHEHRPDPSVLMRSSDARLLGRSHLGFSLSLT
eukprot:958387-Amphidinium_carterae.1